MSNLRKKSTTIQGTRKRTEGLERNRKRTRKRTRKRPLLSEKNVPKHTYICVEDRRTSSTLEGTKRTLELLDDVLFESGQSDEGTSTIPARTSSTRFASTCSVSV